MNLTPKALLLAAGLAALAALPASACSCLRQESAAAQAETADLVFIGRTIDTGPEADTRGWWQRTGDWLSGRPAPRLRSHVTTFQVDEALKGEPGQNIAIRHLPARDSATCGVGFQRDRALVILATRDPASGGYSTSLCWQAQFDADDYRTALSPAPD